MTANRVIETATAARQADALRGPARRAYQAFLDELAASGCAAMGYRLTGSDPLPRLCVKHLRGPDRVIVAFPPTGEAWVLLVGVHARDDPGRDVYDLLHRLAGIEPPDDSRRTKPPCSHEDDDTAPTIARGRLDTLVDEARRLTTHPRRRRKDRPTNSPPHR